MGVISILLGIITFFLFTGAGAIIANKVVEYKSLLALSITSLQTVSNTSVMIGIVCLFAFFGLLIGMGLVMHGLTYNKIAKLTGQLKRKL